jgi:hypothetical protein
MGATMMRLRRVEERMVRGVKIVGVAAVGFRGVPGEAAWAGVKYGREAGRAGRL